MDDYFAPMAKECLQHAMNAFAEMVRLLLGADAVSDRKLECGMPLCILGLIIEITAEGMSCRPHPDKIRKWLGMIAQALSQDCLWPGVASKLAGGLSWAAAYMFKR